MKVFVIIVTYNGAKWIEKCFSSLKESSIPLQILAIDNASSDNTVSQIRSQFPEVEIIETGSNLGFGKANNIGLRKAIEENADYVFLLNQDAWVENDTIEKLVKVAEENKEYGIISPFHFNWEGTKVDHFFLRMVNPDECPNFLSDSFLKNQKRIYSLNFIHAACWLVSKKCLIEVGGFDPLFPHYGEDNDYILRAKIKNFKIGICPLTNVYHYGFFNVGQTHNYNLHLKTVTALLELKKLEGSLVGNYVFFWKFKIDRISTLLLSKKFKNASKELKFAFISFKYYPMIKKSRKISNQQKAFL